MGERTEYAPGTFCWADLATIDQEAAKAFYGELFGWQAEDLPVGEGVSYSMMRLDGKDVAAIAPQPEEQREAGAPPLWNSYVAVERADAAAEKADGLGATVVSAPFDVMDVGRMAVIQDPQGAFFMVWEARSHIGAALVNEPGALCWSELATTDPDAASSFYDDLFGWTIEPFEASDQPYLVVRNGDRSNGGIREVQPPRTPPHWLPYFAVEDIQAALAKLEELGGTKLAGPIELAGMNLGVVRDPQGAVFALYAGRLDP